jgi:uncharacterized membrane protein
MNRLVFVVLTLGGVALAAVILLYQLSPWLFLIALAVIVLGVMAGRYVRPSRRPPNALDRWFGG